MIYFYDSIKYSAHNNSIFAVGDEDQSIYGFRGARTKYMIDFRNMFKDSEILFLSINYRSPRNIVETSSKIISNNIGRNKKDINSKKVYSEEISIIASENEEEEAEKISNVLLKLKDKESNAFDNTAILYRTNKESKNLTDIFMRDNIKFYFLDGEYNFFEHFVCKDLLAYLKLSVNCFDRVSFIRILNKPYRFISKLSIEKLKREKMRKEVYETLCNYDMVSFNQIRQVKAMEKSVKRLAKYSVEDGVKYICDKLGYKEYIETYSKKQGVDIEAFNKIIKDFVSFGKHYNKIEEYIEQIERIKTTISSNNIKKEGVRLSTIHGVKGMEFKNVFIINCNEGNIPYSKDDQCDIEEERRLFYVAMTRTIEKLYICYNKTINGSNKEPSVFLLEGKLI